MTIARWLVACSVAFAALPAHAQSVEAEVLFRDGKKLMKDGKIAEACDKFEASDRLESSVGTLLNLADCREKNGQLASAWIAFRKAASTAKRGSDPKREAEAKRRADALEGKLAYLTISVPDASRIEGLQIARNGQLVDTALWNQGVPVDKGAYEISGQAPGHERWSTRVQVKDDGQKVSVEVPRFKSLTEVTKAEPKPATGPAAPPNDDDEQTDQTTAPGTFTPMRKAAVGVGAAGLVGIGVGVVFGLKAKDLAKQADAICPATDCNDQRAVDLNHDARSKGMIANISFGVGGAAVVGAAVLWFVGAPKATSERVSLVPTSKGFAVVGRF